MLINATDWTIVGSSGGTVTIGSPEIEISVGVSYIRLPIKNERTGEQVLLQGVGGGVSAGVSISIPFVNASGSLDEFPSTGLGPIFRGIAAPERAFTKQDFTGFMTVLGVGGGAMAKSTQISAALWTKRPLVECLAEANCTKVDIAAAAVQNALSITPATNSFALLARTKALGFFMGINVATHVAGGGADMYEYYVSI